MATTSRLAFGEQDTGKVAQLAAAARSASAHARMHGGRSTLPMGRNALCLVQPKDWKSDHQTNYVAHHTDVAGDYARAQELKRLLGGPTASGGRLTAGHPEPKLNT